MAQRHSVDFDPSRSHSHSASNLQNFYASQRYQGRQSEAEQVMQAKRRMAAQRERELRNYHQEQQYNRSMLGRVLPMQSSELIILGVLAEMSSNKSDRSMSPSTMSEEGRRELLARQHRALYGNDAGNFLPQGGFSEEGSSGRDSGSNNATNGGGLRGTSPRAADPFGMPPVTGQQGSGDKAHPSSSMPTQDGARADSATSPATGSMPAQFGSLDNSVQPANHTSTSPAGGESPNRGVSKSTTAPIGSGMGPIGTRLSQQQGPPGQSINKRSTTPLTSPMNNFGFGSSEPTNHNERSDSSNSNPPATQKEASSNMGAWGTGSGVWGSNKIGATSVWG